VHKRKNHDEGLVMTFEVGDLVKPKEGWAAQDIGLVVKVEKHFYATGDRVYVDWIGRETHTLEPGAYLEKV